MDIKLPDISDALKPLPRLKSLVLTEIENIERRHPVDRKIFSLVFAGTFAVLLVIAFMLPFIFKKADVSSADTSANTATNTISTIKSGYKPFDPSHISDRQKQAMETNNGHINEPLIPAPIEALEEPFGAGTIPRISEDGRKPWFSYSRPFDKLDERPRIILVIGGLGLSRLISEAAISDFPGAVSLVFSSFGEETSAWMAKARSLGHEVLLSIPMEPLDFPNSDPGPGTLLIKNNNAQNKALLLKHMVNGKGYLGLTSFSGSRFSTSPEKLRPMLQEIKNRGLIWFDAHLTPLSTDDALAREIGLPSTRADFSINENMSTSEVNQVLRDVEDTAQKTGSAVVVAQATPLCLRLFKEWIITLPNKNISLAPVSAGTEHF